MGISSVEYIDIDTQGYTRYQKKSINIKHAIYKGQISIAYMNSDRIPDIHNLTGNIKWGYNL